MESTKQQPPRAWEFPGRAAPRKWLSAGTFTYSQATRSPTGAEQRIRILYHLRFRALAQDGAGGGVGMGGSGREAVSTDALAETRAQGGLIQSFKGNLGTPALSRPELPLLVNFPVVGLRNFCTFKLKEVNSKQK